MVYSMELGIFSKTFEEPDLEHVLQKMTSLGIYKTQFNLLSAEIETLPVAVEEEKINEIKKLLKKYQVDISAISGTFNMVDNDLETKKEGCKRFEVLCEVASQLEIPIITLCTGSKNAQSKWKWHPDNETKGAWEDLLRTTDIIIKKAEEKQIILGIEIEASNVINTPEKARRYMDIFNSDYLKIIMDAANLFLPNQITSMHRIVEEAFQIVGEDIVLAHAKDLAVSEDISFVAAGEGILDFDAYLKLLKRYGYEGSLIMHGLSSEQVLKSVEFLRGKM